MRLCGSHLRTTWLAAGVLGALLGAPALSPPCQARSLRDALDELTTFADITVPSRVTSTAITIQRNAVRASDFVTTATAPGFFYRFDIETGAAERFTLSGGPVYVEPAFTIGARHVDLALGYQYADFSELEGDSLEDSLRDLKGQTGDTLFTIRPSEFSLVAHVVSLSATYGVTDRWDVNVLVPIILTQLDLRGTNELFVDFALFDSNTISASDEKLGVGDILLRTKYRLPDLGGFAFASALTLRAPSGEEEDFQGLGDTVVTPSLITTRSLGRCDLHGNVGFDANADDYERNRVRYGVGGTCETTRWLTLFAGMVGSSGTRADTFREQDARGEVTRTDIVDAFGGLKLVLPRDLLVHVGALVPATRDGLRADVVPAGGIEKRW